MFQNQTQRNFRKQMKQLQKQGKLPDGYYARRKGFVSGTSIAAAFFILWYFGVFQFIFSLLMSGIALIGSPRTDLIHGLDANDPIQRQAFYAYQQGTTDVDAFIADVCRDIQLNFIEGNAIAEEVFQGYAGQLDGFYTLIEPPQAYLSLVSENYRDNLNVVQKMLNHAVTHSGTSITREEEDQLQGLLSVSGSLTAERYAIVQEIKQNFHE